jgi:hypothetical protein
LNLKRVLRFYGAFDGQRLQARKGADEPGERSHIVEQDAMDAQNTQRSGTEIIPEHRG